jgi:hypothetical protein
MPKFMILIYETDATSGKLGPEETQKVFEKYAAWAKSLSDKGVFLGSERLTPAGRILRKSDKQLRIHDGPFTESKEVFGGYWAIDVASFEEAVECCRNSPHLDYGGMLEIREITTCGIKIDV